MVYVVVISYLAKQTMLSCEEYGTVRLADEAYFLTILLATSNRPDIVGTGLTLVVDHVAVAEEREPRGIRVILVCRRRPVGAQLHVGEWISLNPLACTRRVAQTWVHVSFVDQRLQLNEGGAFAMLWRRDGNFRWTPPL